MLLIARGLGTFSTATVPLTPCDVPCASVRLRAFNLAQQRESFHQDQFDDAGFTQLSESMRTLELGTASSRWGGRPTRSN